jgi:hypothetical protein
VQVDPIKTGLNPPETMRLKVKCDERVRVSRLGSKFNLCSYSKKDYDYQPDYKKKPKKLVKKPKKGKFGK